MANSPSGNDLDLSENGNSEAADPASEMALLREKLMRALAETENTRRQGERQAHDAQQYAVANFARELLQVVDNLRRALDAGAGMNRDDPLMEGVAATDRILNQTLNRFGVREIDALHQAFDPSKHEAVMETEQTEHPPGSVSQVLERGYMLHDRLLRPARVVVAKRKPFSSSSQAAGA